MTLAVRSDCLGHQGGTPRKKKIRLIPYWVFSTFPCCSTMEKGKRRRINDSRKRLKKSTEVGALDPGTYRTMELTELGHDSDQFVVDFDLSAIPEAAKFVAREKELGEIR